MNKNWFFVYYDHFYVNIIMSTLSTQNEYIFNSKGETQDMVQLSKSSPPHIEMQEKLLFSPEKVNYIYLLDFLYNFTIPLFFVFLFMILKAIKHPITAPAGTNMMTDAMF